MMVIKRVKILYRNNDVVYKRFRSYIMLCTISTSGRCIIYILDTFYIRITYILYIHFNIYTYIQTTHTTYTTLFAVPFKRESLSCPMTEKTIRMVDPTPRALDYYRYRQGVHADVANSRRRRRTYFIYIYKPYTYYCVLCSLAKGTRLRLFSEALSVLRGLS